MMDSKAKNKKILFVLLLIVVLGSALRLYHLGVPSLWEDELSTKHRLSFPLSLAIEDVRLVFPPLYYTLMHFWVKVFGNSEFSLRFPSLIFSVLSIIFIFKLAKELFNQNVGLISAFLLSLWPYSINYAQEVKMYSMVWAFGILSFLFFYRFVKENKTRDLVLYVATTAISVYTMHLGFVYIVIQNIMFFLTTSRKNYKKWLLGQLAVIVIYLPWMNNLLQCVADPRGIVWIPKTHNYFKFLRLAYLNITSNLIGKKSTTELFIYSFLIIFGIAGFKNNEKKLNILFPSKGDYFLFSLILAYMLIFLIIEIFFMPVLIPRYLGFLHIPLIILLSKSVNKYNLKVQSALLIFLSFSIFSNHLYPYYKEDLKINGQNWRLLGAELDRRIGSNDLIVTTDPPLFLDYCSKKHQADVMSYEKFYKQGFDSSGYDAIFFIYTKYFPKKLYTPELKDYEAEGYFTASQERIGFVHFRKL